MLREVNQQITQWTGAIIPLRGYKPGNDTIPVERLWHERVLSLNTAAAG
ncbi:MAG: hypothetical protein ACR5LD_02215 [Symbiopectobacterium sp.]